MKKLLLLIISITAYANHEPPIAVAKFCGNWIVTESQKADVFAKIQSQGCENVTFTHIENGYFLAYGTKVLVAERGK